MNKYQKYRYRWETYPTTFRVDKVPIHLDIELTTRCNLRCLVGNTNILMSDYSWKKIKDIKINDKVLGITKPKGKGKHYKYISSNVTNIFPKTKENVSEITLENGVFLRGTPDHLIMNRCGRWIPMNKLTNKIPPKFVVPPLKYIENKEYLKGYVSGAWKSDGMIVRKKRKNGFKDYRARFAVKDKEFIGFTSYSMNKLNIEHKRQKLSWKHPCIKEQLTINNKKNYNNLINIIEIPKEINYDYAKGYLSGFFDGDGSYDGTIIRFINTYNDNIELIIKCLGKLGFKYNLSKHKKYSEKHRQCYVIRIKGGQEEKLRFITLCRPKIPRKFRVSSTVYGTKEIYSIEDKGQELVYNIETKTNNYIANGLIVHNCIMCEHSFNPPEPMDMPFKMVKKIINEFAKKGGSSIKFCYLGEPLLYKKLAKAIKYAKKKGIVETIIATNGNLLDIRKIRALIKSGLDVIIFSVDSCFHDIYKKIRRGGDLSKVLINIVTLCAIKESRDIEKPKTQIQAISIKGYNDIELDSGLYKRAWGEFVDVVRISPYCEDYQDKSNVGETPDFICPSVFRRMTIRANGDMAVCCGARIDSKIIGNIKNITIQEAWLSKKFINIRKLMKKGKSHLVECCKACSRRRH